MAIDGGPGALSGKWRTAVSPMISALLVGLSVAGCSQQKIRDRRWCAEKRRCPAAAEAR